MRREIASIITVVVLLVCPVASALPPGDPAGGSPAAWPAPRPVAAQSLATLAPPGNDAIASTEVVTGLPFTAGVSTLEATTAPDDPQCAGGSTASVWYSYTPPVSTWLTADTFGSDYDTTLSVYTGAAGSLVQVACNDDAGGPQSQVTLPAARGVTYYFMAAGLTSGGVLAFHVDVRFPLPQIGVRTTRAYEGYPSAGPRHFAWAQFPRRKGRFWTLYAQRSGEPRVRVNPRRTDGYSGGFEGNRFVYQQTRGRGDRRTSDLRIFNLARETRRKPPAGVNTRQWEWHPTISGRWLLFGRRSRAARADVVILRNLATGRSIVLDRLPWRRGAAEPGQVSGRYAVWHRCTPRCRVFSYDIKTRAKSMIPNPSRRHHQYDPSVTNDGTVYFVTSGNGCGMSVRLERRPLGGPTRVLTSLRPGWDSSHTFALETPNGTTDFFFERVHCMTYDRDVVKVVDP
ncbi:MAG: hypothetical protein ACRDOG_08885 [Gaiellaceae bacterium]